MTRVTASMTTPKETLEPPRFHHLFVIALEQTKVPRAVIAKACGVLPRTVKRWEDDDCEPSVPVKHAALLALHESGRLEPDLLEMLAEDIGLSAWQLGLGPPPPPEFVPTAAAQKVLDDAVREAAEELAVDPRALRPVLRRLFATMTECEIPAHAAVEMVVRKRGGEGP
jgi:hypothetical protein